MYFMQEAGQPLKLNYAQGNYGPFAHNMTHVLKASRRPSDLGIRRWWRRPDQAAGALAWRRSRCKASLQDEAETLARFDRVAELVEGFETPFGLELLATVHGVVNKLGASSLDEVISKRIAGTNERKKQFTARQIGIAVDVLRNNG